MSTMTEKEEEMKYEEEVHDARSCWLLSFVLGGLIGAGIALLMAPKPGRQTRQQLMDMATEAKGKAEGYYTEAKGKAEGYYTEAKGKAEEYYGEVGEKVHTAAEKGKETYQTKKADVQEAVEKGIAKGREVFHRTKEAAKEE